MTLLQEKIQEITEWRIKEISILKSVPLHSGLSDEQRQVLQKYTIPAMYSLWEGFVKDAFDIYVDHLNSLKLGIDQISPKILTHGFDVKLKFRNVIPADFDKRIKFIYEIGNYIKDQYDKGQIFIGKGLPTESNINHEIINKILYRFNLQQLPEKPFEEALNKFLLFRNRISHGDFRIPVEQFHIDEFSKLVIDLMDEIFIRIDEGYNKKTYLR